MFSFFRKSPPPAAAPAPERPASGGGEAAPTGTGDAAGAQPPRSARDWLNADVGELFFGKKPVEPPATPPATPDASAAAAAVAVARAQGAADVVSGEPTSSGADRSGWMAKLKTGLQRTGGAIAGAFIGAEIGDDALRRPRGRAAPGRRRRRCDRLSARRPAAAHHPRSRARSGRGAAPAGALHRGAARAARAPARDRRADADGDHGRRRQRRRQDDERRQARAPPGRLGPEGPARRRRHLSRRRARATAGMGRTRRRDRGRRRRPAGSRSSARKAAIRPA